MRGVNKMIVEINNPKSDYFEKAILFVKPEMQATDMTKLGVGAEQLLETLALPKKQRKAPVVFAVLGGIIGVLSVGFGILMMFL